MRKTLCHIEAEHLKHADFICFEPGVYEVPEFECYFWVAGFLGSKTLPVKRSELNFIRNKKNSKVLYFPDSKNITFGDFDSYRREIEELEEFSNDCAITIYLPWDYYAPKQIDFILSVIKKTTFRIMVGFDSIQDRAEGPAKVIRRLGRELSPERLFAAFWDKETLERTEASLRKMNFRGTALYV